jgi:hypothetical protein
VPGDYGFDPLNLYLKDNEGQQRMQLAEITHSRLSMIAVMGFAIKKRYIKQTLFAIIQLMSSHLHCDNLLH